MNILKSVFLIGIATLPMIFPLTDDIKCDLDAMQQSLRDKRNRKSAVKSLKNLVQFHSDARQFSFDFSENCNYAQYFSPLSPSRLTIGFSNFAEFMLMILCANAIVTICSQLLLIKMKMVSCLVYFIIVATNCDFHSIYSNRTSIPWK